VPLFALAPAPVLLAFGFVEYETLGLDCSIDVDETRSKLFLETFYGGGIATSMDTGLFAAMLAAADPQRVRQLEALSAGQQLQDPASASTRLEYDSGCNCFF